MKMINNTSNMSIIGCHVDLTQHSTYTLTDLTRHRQFPSPLLNSRRTLGDLKRIATMLNQNCGGLVL